MTTITTVGTPIVSVPRAAPVAAAIFGLLQRAYASLRAQRAERRAQIDRFGEAAAVRRYAFEFLEHDPRFAADLMAAADRHELG